MTAPVAIDASAPASSPCLLRPGETCSSVADAEQVSFLIDAEDFVAALRMVFARARHTIYIVGWDVDTRTPLPPGKDEPGARTETLLALLNRLLETRPELRVYVLSWDFALLYSLERQAFPSYRFAWQGHERLAFALDGASATWASHHQKIVVVDDAVAFVGGIDLTVRRWDSCAHAPHDPRRVGPGRKAYGPMHDVALGVAGPVAERLGTLFRQRWHDAMGTRLAAPGPSSLRLPRSDLEGVPVAIARTTTVAHSPPVREIETLLVEAIGQAERFVLIESQFLTSAAIGHALAKKLSQVAGPEVLAILPLRESGWLEQESLGVLRARLLGRLAAADTHGRLRVLYPEVGRGRSAVPVYVHSKVVVIDDRFVKVGSANMSNRSMGLDTECDLALVAEGPRAADISRAIRTFRSRLLSEHLGCTLAQFEAEYAHRGCLRVCLDTLSTGSRGLRPLDWKREPGFDFSFYDGLVCDPERPLDAEALLRMMMPEAHRSGARRTLLIYLGLAGVALALVAAFEFTSLATWFHPETLATSAASALEHPAGVVGVFIAAVVALCLFAPITLLLTAGALLLPPWTAFGMLYTVAMTSAALSFWVGRFMGLPSLGRLLSRGAERLSRHLQRGGFMAVLTARLLPVGNFGAINLIAGALRVPFASYMIANVVGLLPGLTLICLVGARVVAWWKHPTVVNLSIALLVLAAVAGLLAAARYLFRKRRGR